MLQEEIHANESTNGVFPTLEETLPSMEPINEQSTEESVGVKTSMVESVTPIVHKPVHVQLIVPNSMPPLLTPSGRSIQKVTVEFKMTWEHTMLLPPPKPSDRVENLTVRNSNSCVGDLVIWLNCIMNLFMVTLLL